MDVITVLGAMILAYGGVLAVYYRLLSTEKKKKTSDLMLKGIRSMRSGNLDRALIYFETAYTYCMETDKTDGAAEALYYSGLIYREKGDIDGAVQYLKSADKLYFQLKDIEGNKKVKDAIISIRSLKN